MRRLAVVILVALIGCGKDDKPAVQPAPATAAKQPAPQPPPSAKPAPSAPAPGALPFCTSDPAKEPLAALCRIGGPIDKAHFDCAKPQALAFCTKRGNIVTWACR